MTRFVRRLREIHEALPYWQRLTTERARDAVVAALLHDLGHGPFSHLFEEAIPHGPRHEVWTERLIASPQSEVHQVLSQVDPGLPGRVCELIRGQHPLTYLAYTVSGMLDVDRCDYLLRDALFTGVNYGHYDLDWLLRSLCFGHSTDPAQAPSLAVDGAKGIPAIESFVLARLFMFQQVYFHKASRASEWLLSRILSRVATLVQQGSAPQGVPSAIDSLVRNQDASLDAYLEMDDTTLWQCLRGWQQSSDPILADLCRRLCRRDLFKTHEFFGQPLAPEEPRRWLERARQLAADRGLDPDIYVGLDDASLVAYDDSQPNALRVVFPGGTSRPLAEVSFLLERLHGQRLNRCRLIFPAELRDDLLALP